MVLKFVFPAGVVKLGIVIVPFVPRNKLDTPLNGLVVLMIGVPEPTETARL